MATLRDFRRTRPALTSTLLWLAAIALTIGTFTWQDKTGPTHPLKGEVETAAGPVRYIVVRSETIDTGLPIVLRDPVPPGITGQVAYRRFKSSDEWSTAPMSAGEFQFSRRGRTSVISGVGVELPGLSERAGKYEFLVQIDDGSGRLVSVTGDRAIHARFKGHVPAWALVAHILAIFTSMVIAIRTVLEALVDGDFKRLIVATILSLLLGAFLLGPLVQWYAFGVWWSGIPFGHDWTDNKVLVSLFAWGIAAWMNRREQRSRRAVYAAGVVTLLVYFIPHSVFGSEFDYTTGKGHGTAG